MTKRPGFARFAASSALATSLAVVLSVALQPAFAQVLPTGGVVQAGAVTLRNNGNFVGTGAGTIVDPFVTAANNGDGLGLVVGGANTVLTWDSFSIGGTNNVAFSRNGNAAFTVLNIVTGPTASDLRGALTGNGNGSIWLINPNGIAFNGNGSATNLASLVLSTLPLTEVNGAAYDAASFTGANGSNYRFAGNGTAGITIAANGSLAAGSNLLLVAPQIATAGTLAAGGDAALVVAANTRIAVSASGLLSITIDAGSAVANGLDISGGVTANRLYAVAASAADIAANLLSISGPLVSPNIVVAVGRSAAGSGVSFGAAATSKANVAISRNLPDSGPATSISVESTGDIAVTGAGNADRTITGSYVADGAVSITAGGNLAFADNASVSAGNALLASGDSVTLGTGVALRSDSAGAGGFDLTIAANGNNRIISGDPTSSLAAGMRDAGGTESRTSDVVLTQDAGQALSLGRIDARQLVLTNAASAITLGDVTTTNALALTANGAISLASATSTASGVNLLSNNSSVSVGNTGSAATFDISLTGVGVSSNGSAVSGKDFKVDATTGIATVAGNVSADGIIDVLGGSVVLGTSGQSRTQQAMGLARYEATAGSLSTAGATAIISNSANNVAGANLSLKASAAIAAGAATLSAGTNNGGRRDVSLSAGGAAALTTGAIYANSVGTLDQAGTITIARIDSATAVAATSTAGSVFIGTAGAGNESRAPSFTVTANTAGQTASVLNAIAATGNVMAQATGGSAIANGSGDSIIAMGGNADASGTAATNIIAMATGTARADGIATAGYITADGASATAGGDAGLYIRATGTTSAIASGTTTRLVTGADITATASAGSARASGTARTNIVASGTTTSDASGTAGGNISADGGAATANGGAGGSITAMGGSADASGTAGTNIIATATGTARADGTATTGFVTADGASATAGGDAGLYIRATGTTSAVASGITTRLGTGADITATASAGSADASGTAATDIVASATTTARAVGTATAGFVTADGATATAGGDAGLFIRATGVTSANASGTTLRLPTGTDITATASAGSARASGTARTNIVASGTTTSDASGTAGGNISADGGAATANGGAGGSITAMGGSADASGTAATNIIATATGTARADGTATAGFVTADGASATAGGDAGLYIRATGTTSAVASGITTRLGTGADITATASAGSADASGTAATDIVASATTMARAVGTATAGFVTADGATATAGGDAGLFIRATGITSANASGTTLRLPTGTDIIAIATGPTGSATAGGTAQRDITARANGGTGTAQASGSASRDVLASATGGTVILGTATAGRDIAGSGATITSAGATLTAGDDIVLAATGTATAGTLVLTAIAGPDTVDAIDPEGNAILDTTAAPITGLTGQNIVVLGNAVVLGGDISGPGNRRLEATLDLTVGATGQSPTISADGRLELKAGRSILAAGTPTLRADADGTGNDPLVLRAGTLAPLPGTRSIALAGATLAAGNRIAGVEGRQSDIVIAAGNAFTGLTLGTATDARGLFRAFSESMGSFMASPSGTLDLAGDIDLGGALTVVQRLDVTATDGAITANDVRVLGRADGAARSDGIVAATRDDLVLTAAGAVTVTTTARNFTDPLLNSGGGSIAVTAGSPSTAFAALVTDARARGDIAVNANGGPATLTNAIAGGSIALTGAAATGGQLRAGNDITVTATAGNALVTFAETTYRTIDALLPDSNAFTTTMLADPALLSSISVTATAANGNATLTRGVTADRPYNTTLSVNPSTIAVTAQGGGTSTAVVGSGSVANAITARGSERATITDGLARRGNLEAIAVSIANASGTALSDNNPTGGSIIARADVATASGGADVDIFADGGTLANASGTAGRDIIASAPIGNAFATGTAGRNIIASARTIAEATGARTDMVRDAGNNISATASGGRAFVDGRAGNDLLATATGGAGNPGLATIGTGAALSSAGRDSIASARDGTAGAGSSIATQVRIAAGRDVVASASNATVSNGITAGDDIVLVASLGNVIASDALIATGARSGDVETATTTAAVDGFGAIIDPLSAADIRDPLGFPSTLQNLAGANIIVRAKGAATVSGTIDAAADYRVGASGLALLGGPAALAQTAGNRVILAAGSVTLRDGLSLVSNQLRANIGSAGATIINAQQDILGANASVTARRKAGATQADAPDATLSVAATALPANGRVTIDSVNAGFVTISAPRSIAANTVTAARGVEIAGVVTPIAGPIPTNDTALVSATTITIDRGIDADTLTGPFTAAPITVAGGAGAAVSSLVFANGGTAGAVRILADTGTASLGTTLDVPDNIGSILVESQTGLASIGTAAAGSIELRGRQAGSLATATLLHATGGIAATADLSVTIGTAISDTASILVLANGAATLTNGNAARDIDLRSVNALAQATNLVAGGRIAVSGNSVMIITQAVAGDDLLVGSDTGIAAAGALLSAGRGSVTEAQPNDTTPALETRLVTLTGTALTPALAVGTTGYGNGRGQLVESTTAFADRLTAAPVTGLLGQNVVLTAAGDISVGTVLAARDIIAEAGQNLTLGVADAGRDLSGVSGWRTAANTTIITSATAGDDLVLVAERGNIVATGATLAATGTGADSDASDLTTVTLADRATGLREPFVDFATGKAIAGQLGSNLTLAASGDVTLGASEHRAARDLRIDAGGAISAARLVAGRDLIAVAGLTTDADLTLSGSASAGDDLLLIAQRGSVIVTSATLTTAGVIAENAGDDAAGQFLADRQTALVDPLTGLAVTDITGRNLLLLARDRVDSSAGSLVAASDLRVEAGGSATLFNASAGRDIFAVAGWLTAGDLVIATPADAVFSAGDDLVLLARQGRIDSGASVLRATGLGADNDAGAGAAVLGDGVTGIADIHTGRAIAGLGGSNVVAIARDSIVNSAIVGAARDARIEAGGAVSLATLDAGRDAIVLGGINQRGDVAIGATASAGDDLILATYNGAVLASTATLSAAGRTDSEAGNDAAPALFADFATSISDPLSGVALTRLGGGNVLIGASAAIDSSLGTITAATDVRADAGLGVALNTVTAGRDIAAAAGLSGDAALVVSGAMTAGDDLTLLAPRGSITTTGRFSLAATATGTDNDGGTTPRAPSRLDGSSAAVHGATGVALALQPGSNIVLTARDDIGVESATAITDLRAEAGGNVVIGGAGAGRDLIAVSGLLAEATTRVISNATAGDDLVVVALRGDVLASAATLSTTGTAADNDSSATAVLRLADGTTSVISPLEALLAGAPANQAIASLDGRNLFLIARDSVDSSAGTLTATTDLRVEAGRTATLKTATAGRDLIGVAGWREAGDFIVTGSAQAGDDLLLASQRRDVIVSGATLTATGAGANNDSADATAAVLSNRIAIVEPLTGDASSSVGNTALAGLVGSNLTLAARRDVIGTGASLVADAARDVRVEAGRTLTIGTVTARRDLIAIAGAREDGNLTIVTSATAGDDLVLVARRGDIVATAATLSTTGAAEVDNDSSATTVLRLADGITAVTSPLQGLLAGAPADQAIASLDGRNLFLIARDSVDSSAGTLTATTDLRVEAGRTATLKTATAGRDLIGVAGWREAGDFIVTGSAQAGDDLLLASQRRDVIVSGATLTATGAGTNNDSADTTAAVLANRIAIVEPLTGDAASSFGNTAIAGLAGSNLTLAARRDVIGTGASLVASAARDVRIEAGRTLTIGTASAGRDLVAIAGAREAGNLTIVTGTAGDDIVLVASRGAIDATALMASGSGSDSEAGSETAQTRLADGTTLVEDPTRAGSEPSTAVRFATTTLAGSNIRTASSTASRIDSAKAARDVSIRAGTTAEIANNALSGAPRRPLSEGLVIATTGDIGINAPNSVIVGGSTDAGRNTTIEAFGATGVIRLLQFAGETPLAETADPATLVTMRTRSVFTVASSNLDLNAGGRLVVTDTSDASRFQIDVTGATTNLALGSGRGRAVGTADTGNADFTTRPGFAAPATAGWQLSDGEFGTIRATNVEIFADRLLPTNVKSRNVLIGATTIATPVQRFAVRASGDIVVSGAIQMVRGAETAKDVPAGTPLSVERPVATLTLGGRLAEQDLSGAEMARSVQLVTLTTVIPSPTGTPITEQGSIYAPGTTVRLRGDYVALGLEPVVNGLPFLSALIDSTGSLVTNEDIRLKYLSNPQSTLYVPSPNYGVSSTGASPAVVTATTLVLSPTNWALIQNTDRTGQPGGGLNVARLIVNKPTSTDPLVGVFGSIGGRNGVVAPVNVRIEDINGINPNNIRINGCAALSTASCIVSTLNLSTIGVTDPSRILQVGDAPALDVALPLVTGAGNEALWSDDDEDEDLSLPAAPVKEIKP